MKNKLHQRFIDIYQRTDGQPYFSPARVNLIGEHIDYNGGYVFPCALSFGTYGIIGMRDDQIVRVYSHGFSEESESFSLNQLTKNHTWVDYLKGVIYVLQKNGYNIPYGFDLYIEGNMPEGAGLSSSASVESLLLVMLNDMHQFGLDLKTLALYGKAVENEFIGVNSGMMDQFAVLNGKKDYALMLNTATLDFDYVPLFLDDYQLLVINTNKKRGLADSKYNERFSECQEALAILKPLYGISDLCNLSLAQLNQAKDKLTPILYHRVHHCITEQERTIASAKALANQDIETFSKLLIESHMSLKNDYEVTGLELDTLVEETLKAGAVGARMTGAGFGGCIVSIIKKDQLNDIIDKVTIAYEDKIGYEPSFYVVNPSDGTHQI